jgi:hypothetical protein
MAAIDEDVGASGRCLRRRHEHHSFPHKA